MTLQQEQQQERIAADSTAAIGQSVNFSALL
jgi:hypothetical protein